MAWWFNYKENEKNLIIVERKTFLLGSYIYTYKIYDCPLAHLDIKDNIYL